MFIPTWSRKYTSGSQPNTLVKFTNSLPSSSSVESHYIMNNVFRIELFICYILYCFFHSTHVEILDQGLDIKRKALCFK